MYMALKHSHLLFIALSLSFLAVRFLLSLRAPALLRKKFFKIAPHVVDTFLLLTAIGLMLTIQQYPFQTPWLTEKLLGLFAYIGLAVMALKRPHSADALGRFRRCFKLAGCRCKNSNHQNTVVFKLNRFVWLSG